jgi:membrane associated rhomboid family serine protease
MHFDVPDPRYTGSVHSHALLSLAVRLSIGFVVLLWLIHLMNWAADLDPWPFGVRPREWSGVLGIVTAPLVHSDFAHLLANSLPLATVGAAMLFLYPRSSLRVLPAVYLGPGVLVWVFGRGSVHLGASGIVYGLVSYVFVAGLLRRDRRAIAASLLVTFMYGSLAWGVLPIAPGVSWETHLSAAVIGVSLALALRKLDIPPRKRYAWEEDKTAQDDDEELFVADNEDGVAPVSSDESRLRPDTSLH